MFAGAGSVLKKICMIHALWSFSTKILAKYLWGSLKQLGVADKWLLGALDHLLAAIEWSNSKPRCLVCSQNLRG